MPEMRAKSPRTGLLLQADINPRVPLAMVTISLATLILLPAVIALMRPGFIFR